MIFMNHFLVVTNVTLDFMDLSKTGLLKIVCIMIKFNKNVHNV